MRAVASEITQGAPRVRASALLALTALLARGNGKWVTGARSLTRALQCPVQARYPAIIAVHPRPVIASATKSHKSKPVGRKISITNDSA